MYLVEGRVILILGLVSRDIESTSLFDYTLLKFIYYSHSQLHIHNEIQFNFSKDKLRLTSFFHAINALPCDS